MKEEKTKEPKAKESKQFTVKLEGGIKKTFLNKKVAQKYADLFGAKVS